MLWPTIPIYVNIVFEASRHHRVLAGIGVTASLSTWHCHQRRCKKENHCKRHGLNRSITTLMLPLVSWCPCLHRSVTVAIRPLVLKFASVASLLTLGSRYHFHRKHHIVVFSHQHYFHHLDVTEAYPPRLTYPPKVKWSIISSFKTDARS